MNVTDVLGALPVRRGHFLLESGYHTDLWLTLDALFVDPARVVPLVAALADRLRGHPVSAVCGPLVGGALLAQALAQLLGVEFFYTCPKHTAGARGLFRTEYELPSGLKQRVRGHRVAVVDDVISAGSSVRATVAALSAVDASTTVAGALLILGDVGASHFARHDIPLEALERREFVMWKPSECPQCAEGRPLEDQQ